MQSSMLSATNIYPDLKALLQIMQSSAASGAGQNVQGANESSSSSSSTSSSSSSSTASTPTPDSGGAGQFATQTLASLLNYQQTSPTASFMATQMIDQLGSNGEISLSQVENALGATSSSQIAGLTQAFNRIDTNGDGELSQSELANAIQNAQQSQSSGGASGVRHHHHHFGGGGGGGAEQLTSTQMATDIIDALAPNGNGSLSLSALDTALGLPTASSSTSSSSTSASSTASTTTSSSSSTTSSTSPASSTSSSSSTGTTSLANTLAQEFAKLDTNGDGQLSISELSTAIQAFRQAQEASWSQSWANNAGTYLGAA